MGGRVNGEISKQVKLWKLNFDNFKRYFQMKKMSLLLILLIMSAVLLLADTTSDSFAEDRSKKEFWINKYGEIKESAFSIRAHEVFRRVLAAADRRGGVEPTLYIINFDGVPWAQSLADGSIILSRKGLEFCYKNHAPNEGDSRLAFVIGHELAHQFNGDFWHYKFLRTAEDDKNSLQAFQDIKELAKKPEMLLAKELQADQYGVIYATLAGYKSDKIVLKDRMCKHTKDNHYNPRSGLRRTRVGSQGKWRFWRRERKGILWSCFCVKYGEFFPSSGCSRQPCKK